MSNELSSHKNFKYGLKTKIYSVSGEQEVCKCLIIIYKSKMSQNSLSREPQEIEERLRKKLKENKEKFDKAEHYLKQAEKNLTTSETKLQQAEKNLVQKEIQLKLAETKLQKTERKNTELETKVKMKDERLKDLNERWSRQEAEHKAQNQKLINQIATMQQQLDVIVDKVGGDRQKNERIEPPTDHVSQAQSFKKQKEDHQEDSSSSIKPIHQHQQSQPVDHKGTLGCGIFDAIVPIKNSLISNFLSYLILIKKSLIDKNTVALFQNRLLMAKIFSFYGYRGVVCQLLQRLSHRMRAIAVQTQGFDLHTERFVPKKHLQKQLACGNFDYLAPWHLRQFFHLFVCKLILEEIQLVRKSEDKRNWNYICEEYPLIWIDLLECQGKYEEKKIYVDICKSQKIPTTQFFYGYLLDHFKQMLYQNQFVYGTKTHKYQHKKLEYRGSMDRNGRACGFGYLRTKRSGHVRFTGTFLDDMRQGIGVEYTKDGIQAGYWIENPTQDEVNEKVERFTEEFLKRLGKK